MISTVLRVLAVFMFLAQAVFAENVVLVGGTIIDGSGRARVRGNIRIRDGEIVDIGAAVRPARGEATIDITGLVVAPGFIDLHNHSTTVLENNLGAPTQVAQGITTLVVGLDGEGPFEVEGFMARFDELAPALNIVTYAGHSTIRRQVMGSNFARRATSEEIKQMEEFLEMGMREGAFGLSTSLATGASSSAGTDEIVALARIVARYGGSLAFELRNEGEGILDAVKEVIEIGRQAKTSVQISHLKLKAPSMWGKAAAILAEIDKARTQGIDVAADINSYSEMPGEAATEKDVRDFIRHAWVVVASDGRVGDTHPRGAGTFPRVLSQFVATEKVLTLETAVRKMSALPAARLGLRQRGTLQKGAVADLVIFDPAKVRDLASMQDPAAMAEGMKYVFVNGVSVIKDGLPTDSRPGSGLR